MGITVLSSVSANSALPALSGGAASDALPIDFAALLGEQLSITLAELMPTESGKGEAIGQIVQEAHQAGKKEKDELNAKLSIDPEQLAELAALNPALAAQIQPPATQTGQNLLMPNFDFETQGKSDSKGRLAGLLGPTDESKATNGLLNAMAAALSDPKEIDGKTNDNPQNFALALAESRSSLKDAALSSASVASTRIDPKLANLTETANIAAELPTTPAPQASFSSVLNATGAASQAQISHATAAPHIPTPINETRWAQDFGEKIVWLAKSEQQTAQISINPPQLGPMQISLSLNGDQASAIFASPHAEVRQAIEDAMPRLREMLSSAGISLGDANVGTQLPQQNRDNPSQFSNSNPNGARFQDENAILRGDSKESSNSGTLPIQRGRGLVDLFA